METEDFYIGLTIRPLTLHSLTVVDLTKVVKHPMRPLRNAALCVTSSVLLTTQTGLGLLYYWTGMRSPKACLYEALFPYPPFFLGRSTFIAAIDQRHP